MSTIIRSKAPLRIGLAGGGSDTSPYSELYGGAILNATISMYAYATLEPMDDAEGGGKIIFESMDRNEIWESDVTDQLPTDGLLALHKGAYNRLVKDFNLKPSPFKLSTYVDAPAGSGLGTSSTLLVAILGAFAEWHKLPLGEYDIAHLAWEIERVDLGMAGGKQDQYAAAFGGMNFMEFQKSENVIVNPLRIKRESFHELEFSMLLYYTGTSRLSSKIIEAQTHNVLKSDKQTLEAMHRLKEQAFLMKEVILKGRMHEIGEILDFGWRYKKNAAQEITNPLIDELYDVAMKAGSTGGKISGAGGGGFMMFYCPGNTRYPVIEALKQFGGEFRRFQFTEHGLTSWSR